MCRISYNSGTELVHKYYRSPSVAELSDVLVPLRRSLICLTGRQNEEGKLCLEPPSLVVVVAAFPGTLLQVK